MKGKQGTAEVRCLFTAEGETLEDRIARSFGAFLERECRSGPPETERRDSGGGPGWVGG